MRERIFAYAKFNLDALLSPVTKLRGQPCVVDKLMRPKTGSLNWAIFLVFDDGVEWVFRSPRRSAIITDPSVLKMVISEASTLMFLKTHTSVPVPDVYSFRCTTQFS